MKGNDLEKTLERNVLFKNSSGEAASRQQPISKIKANKDAINNKRERTSFGSGSFATEKGKKKKASKTWVCTFKRSAASFRTLLANISSSFLLGFCSIWRYRLIYKIQSKSNINSACTSTYAILVSYFERRVRAYAAKLISIISYPRKCLVIFSENLITHLSISKIA